MPNERDYFAGCTDDGPAFPAEWCDGTAHDAWLGATRPPADAETLAAVVERIGGRRALAVRAIVIRGLLVVAP